ncbi:RecX family transcriptional regulator [Candidatus Saccharibacteria bacterium]|nr:RecX family transcriptional regulator [Candidatus Saccharibacteria bacterium]
MDIYKLDEKKLQITDLRQGVKNLNRVNVFVDGEFSFSLDVAQAVDFKLKVGTRLSEERLEELKSASEFGKIYQRTLEWVLMRPRSIGETRDYLQRKLREVSSGTASRRPVFTGGARLRSRQQPPKDPLEASLELSNKIVSCLCEKGYLNDERFAEWYVENRFTNKGISKKRLKMELMKKGISSEIIEKVLDVRNDEEEILKMIARKRTKYNDEKLIQYLCRQGFDYQLVQNLVQTYEKD